MSSLISDTAVSLPAPGLRAFITEYAGFRVSGMPQGTHFGLPSSVVDLIISLGRPFDVIRMPNSKQRPTAFTTLVSGLQDAPAVVRQGGDAFGLHVFIKPLGVRAILGVASAEISALVLNLSDIWGNRAGDLIEMLLAANTWHHRFAVLDRAFLSKFNPTNPQPDIAWAWRRLEENPRVCAGPTTRGRNRLEPAALQRPVSRRDRRDAQIRCPCVPVRARMQVNHGRAARSGACGSLVRILRPSAYDARMECARGLLTKGMDFERASIFTRLRNWGLR